VIMLGLALYLPSAYVSSVFMTLYIINFIFTLFTVPFVELSLVGLAVALLD